MTISTRKRKIRILTLFLFLTLLTGSIVYKVYDNSRFIVVQQEVTLYRLPKSFNGFKILQISDLHGRYVGQNQENLLDYAKKVEHPPAHCRSQSVL